jgi:hypothetical protein
MDAGLIPQYPLLPTWVVVVVCEVGTGGGAAVVTVV